jgi:hypothetical protein
LKDGREKIMQKAAHWALDGPVMEDAGDVGGDIQVGPAFSARFRSDDCPEARFEITVYATAKQYMDLKELDPDCLHKEPPGWVCKNGWQESHDPNSGSRTRCLCWLPPEHLACSFKPGTVDVQAEYTYRMNGKVVDGVYESDDTDDISYEWVGGDLGYAKDDGIVAEVERATRDAKATIQDWVANINKYLVWDGRTRPND